MNLEQLVYLVEVARTGSITSAAQNLHVSQSTISKSILRLEEDLRLTLFTRSRAGISPTSVGNQLIRKADEIINKFREFKEIAETYHKRSDKTMKLATVPMFMSIVSKSLEYFLQNHPQIQIEIVEKSSKEILHDIKQQSIDLAFTVLNDKITNDAELESKILFKTKTYVCVNPDSVLATKPAVTPEDITDQKIAIYNGSLKEWFDSFFHKNQPFNYSIITNNIETIKRSVAKGVAISFLSELSILNYEFLKTGNILAIPFVRQGRPVHMQIAWVKLKKHPLSKASKEFLRHLKDHILNLSTVYRPPLLTDQSPNQDGKAIDDPDPEHRDDEIPHDIL
jgi:LysR family transcriptional activator of glutamate synthase operon